MTVNGLARPRAQMTWLGAMLFALPLFAPASQTLARTASNGPCAYACDIQSHVQQPGNADTLAAVTLEADGTSVAADVAPAPSGMMLWMSPEMPEILSEAKADTAATDQPAAEGVVQDPAVIGKGEITLDLGERTTLTTRTHCRWCPVRTHTQSRLETPRRRCTCGRSLARR